MSRRFKDYGFGQPTKAGFGPKDARSKEVTDYLVKEFGFEVFFAGDRVSLAGSLRAWRDFFAWLKKKGHAVRGMSVPGNAAPVCDHEGCSASYPLDFENFDTSMTEAQAAGWTLAADDHFYCPEHKS